MRVAFVVEDLNRRGGTERVVYELAHRLGRRHEVDVLAATADGFDPGVVSWRCVPVPDVPTLLRVPWFARASARAASAGSYDVVVGQGVNCLAADYMLVHTTNAQKAYVTFNLLDRRTPRGFLREVEQRAWFAYACRAEEYLLRKGVRVVALSADVKKEILTRYPFVEGRRVTVINNGVERAEFEVPDRPARRLSLRKSLGVPEDAFLLLFVGGEWHRKGLLHAIDALLYLPRSVHLLVVGKGAERRWRKYCRRLGVAGRAHFFGTTDDPRSLYSASDVFVLPSYYEAFSLAVLEAAAAGLPLLVAPFNGASDVVTDGFNGYIVAREGPDIALKVRELLTNPGARRRMGENARETSLVFTWDAMAGRLEEDISLWLKGRPGVTPRV